MYIFAFKNHFVELFASWTYIFSYNIVLRIKNDNCGSCDYTIYHSFRYGNIVFVNMINAPLTMLFMWLKDLSFKHGSMCLILVAFVFIFTWYIIMWVLLHGVFRHYGLKVQFEYCICEHFQWWKGLIIQCGHCQNLF